MIKNGLRDYMHEFAKQCSTLKLDILNNEIPLFAAHDWFFLVQSCYDLVFFSVKNQKHRSLK